MTLRDDPRLAKTYAGILAASNAVVSKNADRPPHLAPHPPAFRPPSLAEVPRLVADADPLHRAIAGSLCHGYEAKDDGKVKSNGYAEKILLRKGTLEDYFDKLREERKFDDRTEQLLKESPRTLDGYQPRRPVGSGLGRARNLLAALYPTVATVVNPDLQIITEFGQGETNISSARIENYQLLLSEESAAQVLGRSHPLNWQQGARDLFKSVVPAIPSGEKPNKRWKEQPEGERDPEKWQKDAKKVAYLYESAVWPWSESVTLGVENILAISGFECSAEDPKAQDRQEKFLKYTYSLERCMRSDYGVITEELSGLDIDGGSVKGRAVPVESLSKHPKDAKKLKVGDLRQLVTDHELDKSLLPEGDGEDDLDKHVETAKRVLRETAKKKKLDEPWLLTISSSKSLRYTVPQYLPVDLWASLTWTAPALLYTFINRAVCQLPQFVEEEARTGTTLPLIQGTKP